MKTLNKTLYLLGTVLMIMGIFTQNCGPTKTFNFDAAAAGARALNGASTGAILSYCNKFTSPNVSGNIKVFSDTNGYPSPDSVEIILDQNTQNYLAANSGVVRFYKWRADVNGPTYIDSTPMKLAIKDTATNQLLTGQWNEISQDLVNEYFQTHGGGTPQTVAQFLSGKSVVVTGIELTYQAIRVSIQKGTAMAAEGDTLIPAFIADPNLYAQSHAAVLNALHPNVGISGMSESQYAQRLMASCF